MNAAPSATGPVAIELAGLAAPGRLLRAARLYAVVVDATGAQSQRRFVADLPQGAAVFALGAPGVSFVLVARTILPEPLIAGEAPDADAIDAWYQALLSRAGLQNSDAEAAPMEPGQTREVTAGLHLTARRVVWLQSPTPCLRYSASGAVAPSEATMLLVLADQIGAEACEAGEVSARATKELLAGQEGGHMVAALGALSAVPAARIAALLVADDTAERRRVQERGALDEAEVGLALERLDDIALFRLSTIAATVHVAHDPLAGALAVLAQVEGFELRTPATDDHASPTFERLRRFANVSGFRFREVSLVGDWWKEEGPAFLGIDSASGRPRAVLWRRGRWRIVDPETRRESTLGAATVGALLPRGYMFYPALPERIGRGQIWRFAIFGIGGDIVRLLVAAAAATLAGFLIPVATSRVLGAAIPDGRSVLLRDMMIVLVAASIGSACFQVVRAMATIRLGTQIDRRLQAAVWDRVMRLRTSFFRRYSVGDLASRILGIDSIRRILAGQSVNGVISGVFAISSLGIMLIYDAALTAFALGYVILAAALLFGLARAQMLLTRIVYDRKGRVTGLLMEILGGIAKLRVAGAELRAFARWSNLFAEQRRNDAIAGQLGVWQTVAASSMPIAAALCVFAIAGGGDNPVDVASFAAFNSAFGQFTSAFLSLTTALNVSIEAAPLFARIRPVFEASLEVEGSRVDPGTLRGHVAVRNLSFRYAEDGPWILENVDFEARPGENVAIVGSSGSGKSTLLRLLLGFEAPERGGVFYDGKDLETLDLRLVRRQIGTVLETAGLMPGSIFDNIAGSAQLTREQVMEAVRLAGLDDDIAAMPMGLESFIMEGGSQISGGQRQRVMIARALVHRPRLIFFDQATSALDNRTQAIVGASLAAMNATRIVIAHRLSTIRDADRIDVMEAGRIVESGTYDELMARDGAFHRLVQRQLL